MVGWRMMCREFSVKFPKIWDKFPRKFREISGKRVRFTEITAVLKFLLKLSPTTEITNLASNSNVMVTSTTIHRFFFQHIHERDNPFKPKSLILVDIRIFE